MKAGMPKNFIRQAIDMEIASKADGYRVVTRFPPEPNGYLHIGHAKAICLNFGIARDYPNSQCRLRFDDTNPEKENTEFMESIKTDVAWLGFKWHDVCFASDYFEKLYDYAVILIKNGKAYVDSTTSEEIRVQRGTLTEPGKNSLFRDRSINENLTMFEQMRLGKFEDGEHVLRAKIDMTSPNINMRDPILYRIRHKTHYRTGDQWCIYPMYDYTQCLSDAIEGVTHSLCTLEFEDHRPLYEWVLQHVATVNKPRQIEFSRLNLTYTVMSKRLLKQLVQEHHVTGWDDPRMPTLSGIRRRGYTPGAIVNFCERVGITKKDNTIDLSSLENSVREDLDSCAPRRLVVLDPLKVTITNYPNEGVELLLAPNHPNDNSMGAREIPFTKTIYIERDDFLLTPPKKYFRLGPGREVRLRYAYYIQCVDYVVDSTGRVTEVLCTYDPETRGGSSPDGRKVKGTIHWVSESFAGDATVKLYDRLFKSPSPSSTDYASQLNSKSLVKMDDAKLEQSLADAQPGQSFQFERLGYFCVDLDSTSNNVVFNRTVTLRDSWDKIRRQ